jgi:macrolide transport system ATP-binding/permease protein
MQTLIHDLRYGLRLIAKSPAFTLVAVLTLALGICANTTIFSFINGMLLRPLPGLKEPERLVAVYTSDYSSGPYGGSSYPDYIDFRDQADAFDGLAAYESAVMTLSVDEGAERLRGMYVTGNFFDVLGVKPALGRVLQSADDTTSETPPVVISYSLWQRLFRGDAYAIGQTLKLNGRVYPIVGVTDQSFRGLRLGLPPQFWFPMGAFSSYSTAGRGDRGIELTARLKPGVSIAQAQSQLTTIAARLAQAYPETNMGTLERLNEPRPITVVREGLVPAEAQVNVRFVSMLLLAAVGLVLLIVCANVANLMMARASVRRREIAIRLALGAHRWRLIRQLLTESFLLAAIGGSIGLLATQWTARALPAFFPAEDPGGLDLGIDWRVLVFTLGATLLTGIAFGLAPALQATRPNLMSSLKDDDTQSQRFRRLGLRNVLVVSQLALSLVLLIGAALFVRSLIQAVSFDPGFASKNLLIASIETRGTGLKQEQGRAFYDQALQRVGTLPGVQAVTMTRVIPISGGGQRRGTDFEGYEPKPNEDTETNTNIVGLDFFSTMGIPIVQGRDFNGHDVESSPRVVIVNEELARRYFAGQNAIGKWIRFGAASNPQREIVGIARNAKYRNLREQPLPFIYLPLGQEYQAGMTMMVRTQGDPSSLVAPLRNEMRALNKEVPVFAVQTMTDRIGGQLGSDRMIAVLLSIFGGLALMLAAIGVYGVMAYSVAQRNREIGIRMALGAERTDILKLIVGQGLTLVIVGAGVGLLLSFALTRVLKNLLFGISATDPLTFGVIVALMMVVGLLACYLPARRATKVDPLVALRYE